MQHPTTKTFDQFFSTKISDIPIWTEALKAAIEDSRIRDVTVGAYIRGEISEASILCVKGLGRKSLTKFHRYLAELAMAFIPGLRTSVRSTIVASVDQETKRLQKHRKLARDRAREIAAKLRTAQADNTNLRKQRTELWNQLDGLSEKKD